MKEIKAKLDKRAAVKSTFAKWLGKRKLFGVPLAKLLRFNRKSASRGSRRRFRRRADAAIALALAF